MYTQRVIMRSLALLTLCEAFPEGHAFIHKEEVFSLPVAEKIGRIEAWFCEKSTRKAVSKIKILVLSHKGIDELPTEIGLFKNLRWLDVSGNKLTAFPSTLLKLKKIRHLMCRNNSFSSEPLEKEKFPQLVSFWY
jgi:hypothetical protein